MTLPPTRYLLQGLDSLTVEEQDLYFEVWCHYCGKLLQESEYNEDNHLCASKQAVKGYYKQDFI